MNILLITPNFPPEITGAGHLYFELAKSMVDGGHKTTVVTCFPRWHINEMPPKYKGKIFMWETMEGIQVIRVKMPPLPLKIPAARGIDHFLVAIAFLIRSLFLGKQDIILVYSPPLPLGLTAFTLGKIRKIPFIFNVQDIFPRYAVDSGVLRNRLFIWFFEVIERFVYRQAKYISVHSPGNRKYLSSRGVPESKLAVIPNWVDVDRVRAVEKYNGFSKRYRLDDKFVVSYAGTMGYAQDVNTIIKTAALLKSYKNILFLLVGEGPEKQELVKKSKNLMLNNVMFLPTQPWAKYLEVLQSSDVSMVNLKKELSTPVVPSKIFNIMASSRPTVASIPLDGDAAKIIKEAQCGLCVPAGDKEKLAQAILHLHENPSLRKKMGENGRIHVERYYSRTACADKYEELFLKALNSGANNGVKHKEAMR